MVPEWHQLVPKSEHIEELEIVKKMQLYATSIFQVHSIVHQLDYLVEMKLENKNKNKNKKKHPI